MSLKQKNIGLRNLQGYRMKKKKGKNKKDWNLKLNWKKIKEEKMKKFNKEELLMKMN